MFHNGTPFAAPDHVYMFERVLDPRMVSPVGGSWLGSVNRVAARDDHILVLTRTGPFFPPLINLTQQLHWGWVSDDWLSLLTRRRDWLKIGRAHV